MKKVKVNTRPIMIEPGVHSLKTKIEICYDQYLRFERDDGAYIGALDPISKRGKRDIERLKKWCSKILRSTK
jgi:hypothetical protein